MKRRTILIFPTFSNIKIIDDLRQKYDPLANIIEPHITLVFPFKSNLKKEDIVDILNEMLKNTGKFILSLKDVSKSEDVYGNYLFLNIDKGYEDIIKMNNSLYNNSIIKIFRNSNQYVPHLTIGNFKTREKLYKAYNRILDIDDYFETEVDKVYVEIIGENKESIIEHEFLLREEL